MRKFAVPNRTLLRSPILPEAAPPGYAIGKSAIMIGEDQCVCVHLADGTLAA